MIVLLWREGSNHTIDGKYPNDTSDFEKKKIEGDALSVIQLSLAPNLLCDEYKYQGDDQTVLGKAGRDLPRPVSNNNDVVITMSSHI
ncbi:hypothetical protein KY284_012992 [Solanum tuberosum]|nr:hypothetical protein KY284_012992 [Solanum tuberosum]